MNDQKHSGKRTDLLDSVSAVKSDIVMASCLSAFQHNLTRSGAVYIVPDWDQGPVRTQSDRVIDWGPPVDSAVAMVCIDDQLHGPAYALDARYRDARPNAVVHRYRRRARLRTIRAVADADGAFATCHSLSLPASEPGYYFWRDRVSGRITRRSEWFVTKSPVVTIGARRIKYLLSFALPRFCDQSLDRSRKERFYRRTSDAWIAKLDTVVHELYHIDPEKTGIRRIERGDGTHSSYCHGPRFFEEVAQMVTRAYLDTPAAIPSRSISCATISPSSESRHGGVAATSFRTFPSFPQRYIERLAEQPPREADLAGVKIEPLRVRAAAYTRLYRERSRRPSVPEDASRRLAQRKGRVQSRVALNDARAATNRLDQ